MTTVAQNEEERGKAIAGIAQNEKIKALREFIATAGAEGWNKAWCDLYH